MPVHAVLASSPGALCVVWGLCRLQMPSAAAEGARPAEEEEPQQPEVPTKLVTSCVSLVLQAAVR